MSLRFITVGDPHQFTTKIQKIVSFINRSNVDFAVFLGDIDQCDLITYNNIKNELSNLNKKYYILGGNHDLSSVQCGSNIDKYGQIFSPLNIIDNVKGYQIVTASWLITNDWSFLFNGVDKNRSTLVFTHGPVVEPQVSCPLEDFHRYNFTMKSELDKLRNLICVYAGHIHESDQGIYQGIRQIIEDATVESRCNLPPTNKIGYTRVSCDDFKYTRLDYNSTFTDPFPGDLPDCNGGDGWDGWTLDPKIIPILLSVSIVGIAYFISRKQKVSVDDNMNNLDI